MKPKSVRIPTLLCTLAVAVATGYSREASAAYRMISAGSCEDYHLATFGGSVFGSAWFYNGVWWSSGTGAGTQGWLFCPLPFDDSIQPYNATTTYVFVYDGSASVEATARSCSFDAFAMTASCGASVGTGVAFTGSTFLAPPPPPAAPHFWASYFLSITMPTDASRNGVGVVSY